MKINTKHDCIFCSKYFKASCLRPNERWIVWKLFGRIAATEAKACSSGRMNMDVKKAMSGGKFWTLMVLMSNYSRRYNMKNNAAPISKCCIKLAVFLCVTFSLRKLVLSGAIYCVKVLHMCLWIFPHLKRNMSLYVIS